MFVLSILLRYLKPLLRASAGVGSWQARRSASLHALRCLRLRSVPAAPCAPKYHLPFCMSVPRAVPRTVKPCGASFDNIGIEVWRFNFRSAKTLSSVTSHTATADGESNVQVVSQAEAAGEVVALPSLGDIQGQSFGSPTVLVTQQVGGVEDIPVRSPLPMLRPTSA